MKFWLKSLSSIIIFSWNGSSFQTYWKIQSYQTWNEFFSTGAYLKTSFWSHLDNVVSITLHRTLYTFYLEQPNYRCIWNLNFFNFNFENFQTTQSRGDCQVKSEESFSTIHCLRMIKMQILSARNLKHENEYFYFPKNKLCYWRIEDAKRYNSKLTATSEFISGIW